MKSEIFEAYAAEMDTLLEGRDELVKEARTPKQIEKDLYGIKPNKKMKPILERAHPHGGYVVAPAYDPANGVMATPGETQALVGGVANSDANGNYFQKSWIQATEDLKEELIGIAFELDNKEELELMKLADSCTERLEKKSALPLLAGLGAGAWWLLKQVAWTGVMMLGMGALEKATDKGATSKGGEKAKAGRIRALKRRLPSARTILGSAAQLGAAYFAFKGFANLMGPLSEGLKNDAQSAIDAIEKAVPEVGPRDARRLRQIAAQIGQLHRESQRWEYVANELPVSPPQPRQRGEMDLLEAELRAFRVASLRYSAYLEETSAYLDRQVEFLERAEANQQSVGEEARWARAVYQKAFPAALQRAIKHIETLSYSVRQTKERVALGLEDAQDQAAQLYERSMPLAERGVRGLEERVQKAEEEQFLEKEAPREKEPPPEKSWMERVPGAQRVRDAWDELRAPS